VSRSGVRIPAPALTREPLGRLAAWRCENGAFDSGVEFGDARGSLTSVALVGPLLRSRRRPSRRITSDQTERTSGASANQQALIRNFVCKILMETRRNPLSSMALAASQRSSSVSWKGRASGRLLSCWMMTPRLIQCSATQFLGIGDVPEALSNLG